MKNNTISWTGATNLVARIEAVEQEEARQEQVNIQQEQERKAEFEATLSEAKEDVMERIYETDEPFSYNDIEDIMLNHGLEMDYIEDFLL